MGKPRVTLVKKSAMRGTPSKGKAGAVVDFQIVDNENSSCSVFGIDAAGNTLDIASVAKLDPPPTSSDPSKLTVDPPNGMTFNIKTVGPLTDPGAPVIVTTTASWLDGSLGPFTFELPCDIVAGQPGGIFVVPGPPVMR